MRMPMQAREIILAVIVKVALLAVIFVLFFSGHPPVDSADVSRHLMGRQP